jgi:hypothetical protein
MIDNLDLPIQSVDVAQLKKRYQHLKNLAIPDLDRAKPGILIGHAKILLGDKSFAGKEDEPIALKTRLGWTVFDNASPMNVVILKPNKQSGVQISICERTHVDEEIYQLVKSYFSTKNFGVMQPKNNLIGDQTQRAI